MTYDWFYLCSDVERLKLTLRALPPTLEGLRALHVCWASHLDPADRKAEIELTMGTHLVARPRCPIPCYDTLDLTTAVRTYGRRYPQLATYLDNAKPRWALGMKLLIPLLARGPYLYTDDDVLVTRDPHSLLEVGSFGSKGCYRFDGKKPMIAEQLFGAFDIPTDPVVLPGVVVYHNSPWRVYDWFALDAGVWFDAWPSFATWSDRLERLAALPYVRELTTRNLELRCLDQRFLTCYGLAHRWTPRSISNGFAPPAAIRPEFFANKTFFHYKSASKPRWMRLIREHLDARA